jgi:hypothetical protein
VNSPANIPSETAKDIKEVLMTPGQNYGKDRYTIDLTGSETTYCLARLTIKLDRLMIVSNQAFSAGFCMYH